MYLKHVITAGILSAALAFGPGAAFAQTSGSSSSPSSPDSGAQSSSSQGSSSSTQGSQSGTTTSSSSTSQQSGTGSSGQEAVRQHLTSAREALAELTKLPAATQLQGEQRQRIAQFISDFNTFATSTTDWRPKYDAVDRELDQLLGLDGAAGTSGSAGAPASPAGVSGTPSTTTGSTPAEPGAPPSSPTSGAPESGTASAAAGAGDASALDPTIVAKLREVRTHLDQFEEASGDPTFVVEKIEKILDQAGGGSASGAVGTSGSDAGAGGSITLTAAQVQELRRQLDVIKAAAKK